MRRLENRINATRTKIGRVKEYQRGNRSMRVVRKIAVIVKPKELRDLTDANMTEVLDIHVQRLSALSKRLRRYAKCSKRKEQNRM